MAAKKKSNKEVNSDLLERVNKVFGAGSIMKVNSKSIEDIERYPIKFVSLNRILGGGLPKGRIIEIYGPEASGKTTLCIHCMEAVQAQGDFVVMIDTEHSFNTKYAESLGVDMDKLYISQPDSGEQALEMLDMLISEPGVGLIIVDSVAALTPQSEIDGEMGDSKMGLQARLMSQAMRKITAKVGKSNKTILFTNQLREKLGILFGSPETTTGGNALKFYASIRLDVRVSTKLKDGDKIIGNLTKIKTAKNKTAPPFQTCEMDLYYGKGYSYLNDIIALGIEAGIIERSGSWFSYDGTKLGQGRTKVVELLESNLELVEELVKKINANVEN